VLETSEDRFASLPGYPYEPRYVSLPDRDLGDLRMNHVDAGPAGADPVLLLHGQPTWSYLYRKVIAGLVDRGHRCVAPDLIGYGRSDKPDDRFAYSFRAHVRWLTSFVEALDLTGITLVCQDWGGPIGLAVLAAQPERFARVVAANTILHTSDEHLAGRLTWANHGIADDRVVLQEALVDYVATTMRSRQFDASTLVRFATVTDVPEDVLAAYDAPFPDEAHKTGMRQMTALVPLTRNDPGARIDRRTFEVLRAWDKPFLTAYSDGDPATAGWERVFQEEVPGAKGLPHVTIAGAGHFLQEDRGAELATIVADLIDATPPT
jgi:haloalkane dehalogenase